MAMKGSCYHAPIPSLNITFTITIRKERNVLLTRISCVWVTPSLPKMP
ncbi:uncharacterized protein G2W53_027828 [Senna tora]|uniref:Uncharacterized protein n=1 Tax=Senna tora TaxID=362788 RepID=A0A834THN3_9FABA|nr:uncharacterized protein G2W53_027828 [Senna tora]